MSHVPLYIKEQTVREILTWRLAVEATKQALSAVSNGDKNHVCLPIADQPARTFTWTAKKAGVLLSMPAYAGNYSVGDKKFNTLGCKLVTAFPKNCELPNALPNLLANIFLMDSSTGQLKCVMEATDITAWRTAAASINATKYLYYGRSNFKSTGKIVLAILGCGVEGRHHALGMCSTFEISKIRLWNRTKCKADTLKVELNNLRSIFLNSNVEIEVFDSSDNCASTADIIVTATFAESPIVSYEALKENVHINAVGAAITHYSELSEDIYSNGKIYVDHMTSAENELKGLNAEIVGEVGEVINGSEPPPTSGLTIFQSMGMACEDLILAEAIFEAVSNREMQNFKVL